MAQTPKLFRMLFLGVWFVGAPMGLALLAVNLLRAPPDLVPTGLLQVVRAFVRDQEVPAGIVLFTFFEMALYSVRHHLPLADGLSVAGRHGLPREIREEFEAAAHLSDEVARIQRERKDALLRDLPRSEREELDGAFAELRRTMEDEPFSTEAFRTAHERATVRARVLGPWRKSELREYVESIGVAVMVAVLLRAVVVEAFKIPSGSMLPTLQIGDHIFVNKFLYGPVIPFTQTRVLPRMPPSRGDVIVFRNPDHAPTDEAEDYIKRVIGLPGDILEAEDGRPVINGWRVPRCRVGTYTFAERPGDPMDSGELFVEFLGEASYLTFFEPRYQDPRESPPVLRKQGPFVVQPGEAYVFGDNRDNSRDSREWFGGRGGGVPFADIKGRALFVWLPAARFLVDVMGSPQLPKGAPPEMVQGISRCLGKRPPLSETTPPGRHVAPAGD